MSQELIYTSVPRGLRPGSKGFCTVAQTADLTASWAERLESLSGYRPVFQLGDPSVGRNPINWAHWRVNIVGKTRSVLSRVAFAGVDYSQRSNKFAHHLVLDPAEQAPGGPAWLMSRPGLMKSEWTSAPGLLPSGPSIPQGDRTRRPCAAWAKVAGDAGWAGVLAKSFLDEPAKPAYLIFSPGVDLLPLIDEALGLLPPDERWQVTFTTYFTELPAGLTVAWRGVAASTAAAKEALRLGSRALVIDLRQPLGQAPDSPLAIAARTGQPPAGVEAAGPRPAMLRPQAGRSLASAPLDAGLAAAVPSMHRHLAKAEQPEFVEESFLPDSPSAYRTSRPPRKSGAAGWIAACVACLLLGAAGEYLIAMRRAHGPVEYAREAEPAPATQTATDNSPGPRTGNATPIVPPGPPVPASAPTVGPAASSAPNHKQDVATATHSTSRGLSPLNTGNRSDLNAPQTIRGAQNSGDHHKEHHKGPAAVATQHSAPGLPYLVDSVPKDPKDSLVSPGESGFSASAKAINLGNQPDAIDLFFPNGENKFELGSGGTTLSAKHLNNDRTTIEVHLTSLASGGIGGGETTDRIVASFQVKDKKLDFSWRRQNYSELDKQQQELRSNAWKILELSVVASTGPKKREIIAFSHVPLIASISSPKEPFQIKDSPPGVAKWVVLAPGDVQSRHWIRASAEQPDLAYRTKQTDGFQTVLRLSLAPDPAPATAKSTLPAPSGRTLTMALDDRALKTSADRAKTEAIGAKARLDESTKNPVDPIVAAECKFQSDEVDDYRKKLQDFWSVIDDLSKSWNADKLMKDYNKGESSNYSADPLYRQLAILNDPNNKDWSKPKDHKWVADQMEIRRDHLKDMQAEPNHLIEAIKEATSKQFELTLRLKNGVVLGTVTISPPKGLDNK